MDATKDSTALAEIPVKYAHIFRRKTTWELVLLSGAVCGIEFCYAAETAFISPTLLGLGLPISYAALTLCLSPVLGFSITPVLGSLSDACTSRLGRRRPFIVLLSVGMLCGLILLPNGKQLGIALGDTHVHQNTTLDDGQSEVQSSSWGIAFTLLGFVLLDSCCDACQSPSRSYVLDVTIEADHTRALTAFTIMSGLGGCMGYLMGAIDWERTAMGSSLGGQVHTVFAIVGVFFVVCVSATLTSFKEMPLPIVMQAMAAGYFENQGEYSRFKNRDSDAETLEMTRFDANQEPLKMAASNPTLKTYLRSIVVMPRTMWVLCLTNLFCWMSLLCYSLFLTEFVGAVVFGGEPAAPMSSEPYRLYQEGVRLGCSGMAVSAVSCSAYSMLIERLVCMFGKFPRVSFVITFFSLVMTPLPFNY